MGKKNDDDTDRPDRPLSEHLRPGPGQVDIRTIPTDAAPGYPGEGKDDADERRLALAPELSDLQELLYANGDTYECPWKGHADYYDVIVGDQIARGAAWMYPEPKPAAADIAGHFAFWRGVRVIR